MLSVPSESTSGGGPAASGAPGPLGRRRRVLALVALAAAPIVAIVAGVGTARAPPAPVSIEAQADDYVGLVLAFGRVEPGEVDAFFGPAALMPSTGRPAPTLAAIRARAARLLGTIAADHAGPPTARHARLADDVRRFIGLIDAAQASTPPRFDQEALQVYGVDVGTVDDRRGGTALAQLAALLPGVGPLPGRVAAFRARLAIPEARRAAVFGRALAECRRRTAAHWPLPPDERVEVRWDRDVPAAWQRYRGHDRSTLQVNPQAVAFVGAAIDTACHEAYPGHHAQFLAMDAAAAGTHLPVEDQLVLLRSPATMLREGAANFGVRLAFPLAERAAFARDVLYPMAGLPPRDAERDARVHQLLGDLEASVVPILRAYRDGGLPFDAAARALRDRALIASPEALLRFTDDYGALVIGYTIARDRVAAQVAERSARTRRDPWAVVRRIVATSDLSALAALAPRALDTSQGN